MKKLALLAIALASVSAPALAVFPSYGTPGTENPDTYSFTASSTGDLLAYFAGSSAGYTDLLGVQVNGVDSGILGLNNHTTALGATLNFGPVTAGDVLTFYIKVTDTGDLFYSDASLNSDSQQHAFSAAYAGGDFGIPAGQFVSFEDLNGGGDHDYNDVSFVIGGISGGGVPEPASWAMMLGGFGLVGGAMRRRQKISVRYC